MLHQWGVVGDVGMVLRRHLSVPQPGVDFCEINPGLWRRTPLGFPDAMRCANPNGVLFQSPGLAALCADYPGLTRRCALRNQPRATHTSTFRPIGVAGQSPANSRHRAEPCVKAASCVFTSPHLPHISLTPPHHFLDQRSATLREWLGGAYNHPVISWQWQYSLLTDGGLFGAGCWR